MIRTILGTSVSFCPSFCIFVLLTASFLRAGNAAAALQISNENAPAGGFAQIKIYAAKPAAIASGHIVVTLDQTFFGNTPQVGLFGANGDALGLATVKWPQIDIQFSSATGGIGQLAGLPVIVISVPVLTTATGTSVVSATSPDGSATVVSGSVTVQGILGHGHVRCFGHVARWERDGGQRIGHSAGDSVDRKNSGGPRCRARWDGDFGHGRGLPIVNDSDH